MRKNWRDGDGLLFKNDTIDDYAYQPCYSRAGFTLPWALLHFGDFCNIFLANIGKDQKKSYHLSAKFLGLCHVVNPALVIALRS